MQEILKAKHVSGTDTLTVVFATVNWIPSLSPASAYANTTLLNFCRLGADWMVL